MLIHNTRVLLATLLVFLIMNPAQAEKHHEGDHHKEDHHKEKEHDDAQEANAEAHTHGSAELLIVLDGQELQIELHSPAMNLVGFEHEVRNEEQEAKVESTKLILEDADKLFQVNSARCQLSDQKVDLGSLSGESKEHDDEHETEEHDEEHADDDHEAEKHHDEHADEDHESEEHDEEHESHSDIEAQYRYSCSQPNKINSLVTTIADEFPGIESLEVQWIINGRQGAEVLEEDQREVIFK